MNDSQAAQLLDLLALYAADYEGDVEKGMTVADLAGDLAESIDRATSDFPAAHFAAAVVTKAFAS